MMRRSLVRTATLLLGLSLGLSGCGFLGANSQGPSALNQAVRVNGAEAVAVNRYLWSATLDVLSFLPVQQADPFTGVIATGYGTPPGGNTAYRATAHISSPALDARSLNLSLLTRSGPVSAQTLRRVENAILLRARQLRVAGRGS